jgi:hypothetical protein
MFSNWQKRILLLCQRKSGLLDVDVSKLWKKSANVESTRRTALWRES